MNNVQKKWIVGVDEVGRGPLAGPVTIGVFALPVGYRGDDLKGIRDSKKLSEKKRNEWVDVLRGVQEGKYAVVSVSPQTIDSAGIQASIRSALASALQELQLESNLCEVFLDGGLHAPSEYVSQKTVVKGDDTVPVISAAAIMAKVTRDRLMVEYDSVYPEYQFAKHKGYGTKVHREAIAQHGFSPIHRRSFCKSIVICK